MTFGERIRQIRKAKGWRQRHVAERLGVIPETISLYETGAREPSLKNLVKLCGALGCTPNDLIGVDQREPITCTTCGGAGIIWREK